MVLTPETERWAEALAVVSRYGDRCFVHVAERMGALALADDPAGVQRWQDIAVCIDKIAGGTAH